MKITTIAVVLCAAVAITSGACSKNDGGSAGGESAALAMGVGPVQQKMTLATLNPALVALGQKLFQEKCSACHKIGEKYVGPDLKGVTQRRSPEWVMNMVLNPQEMTQKDPVAKELLGTFLTQMTFQNVSQEDARAILEFFRQNDAK